MTTPFLALVVAVLLGVQALGVCFVVNALGTWSHLPFPDLPVLTQLLAGLLLLSVRVKIHE